MEQYIKYDTPSNISDILIKCLMYNNYRVGVFCDKTKIDILRGSIIKILKFAGVNFRVTSYEIVFIDQSSVIRFCPINSNVRGQRYHEAILAGKVSEEFVNCWVRPYIRPYRREG